MIAFVILLLSFLSAGAADAADATDTADAEEFAVAGRSLVLSPPPGYCALSGDKPEEAELIERLRKGNAGRNEVLLAFAHCGERDRWRRGGDRDLLHHGHFLVGLSNGKAEPLATTSREAFIAQLERAVPKLDRSALKDAVNKAIAETDPGLLSRFQQGIAGKDDNGLYVGSLGVFEADGRETRVAGMTLITLIQGVVLSANLYQPFETEASFDSLLAEMRPMAAALVAANQPPSPGLPPSPPPSPRSKLPWLGLLVALGLWGAVPYLRRRKRVQPEEDHPCT